MVKQKYPSINGLRCISIILVIIHHLSMHNNIFAIFSNTEILIPLISLLQDGHLGVNIFFVISGFLITSLMQEEEINTKTISLKNFYVRRILRIFPAYYFLLLIYFILQIFDIIQITYSSWITAITYTKYLNWKLDWFTAHSWSLSIEENFYLFWPFIFISGKKFRKIISIIIILIAPLFHLSLTFNPIDWMSEAKIFTRIDAISTGCFFALYKDDILKIINPYFNKLFYFSSFCLFLFSYLPLLSKKINLSSIFLSITSTHGTIANFLIGIIVMYSIFGPKKLWFKFLNLKSLNYIGLLSYSIYLWQQIFISGGENWMVKFPQNIIFVIIMSLFSYYIIEKPFLRLKSKFYSKKD